MAHTHTHTHARGTHARTCIQVRDVLNATRRSNGVLLDLDMPLQHRHVSVTESYGAKSSDSLTRKNISMRAEVALLNRNIVVRSGDTVGPRGYMNTSDSLMGARLATFDLEEKFAYVGANNG